MTRLFFTYNVWLFDAYKLAKEELRTACINESNQTIPYVTELYNAANSVRIKFILACDGITCHINKFRTEIESPSLFRWKSLIATCKQHFT